TVVIFLFFSSRRRHTRFSRDWSSDVCSSDLTSVLLMVASGPIGVSVAVLWLLSRLIVLRRRNALTLASARGASDIQLRLSQAIEIGRASCRESVEISAVEFDVE